MYTCPASSVSEAAGSLAMHCHYDSFSPSVSLQKFQGTPLVFFSFQILHVFSPPSPIPPLGDFTTK